MQSKKTARYYLANKKTGQMSLSIHACIITQIDQKINIFCLTNVYIIASVHRHGYNGKKMKFTHKKIILFTLCFMVVLCLLGWWLMPKTDVTHATDIRPGYVSYDIAQDIVFAQDGNSGDFVRGNIGWGGQEPKHRCIVGKTAEMKLFIYNSDNSDLRLILNAFGVYSPDTKCQEITVYANDVSVAQLCVASRDLYTAIIPAKLIPDGHLHLRFDVAEPYVVDNRLLGAAVRGITFEKMRGNQTKKKLSLWLQNKLWGGPVQNPYATNKAEDAVNEKSK